MRLFWTRAALLCKGGNWHTQKSSGGIFKTKYCDTLYSKYLQYCSSIQPVLSFFLSLPFRDYPILSLLLLLPFSPSPSSVSGPHKKPSEKNRLEFTLMCSAWLQFPLELLSQTSTTITLKGEGLLGFSVHSFSRDPSCPTNSQSPLCILRS